jgi:4-amino-4-deoxy-L-arabinose transferase-like glycosyltransferase
MSSVPARAALLGALFAALVTLPGLGSGTLWDNSETAYGEVAREVVLTHDWVVMHLNGQPWFVQPPLYFWLSALLMQAFGVDAFALRLPSALATIAMGGAIGFATARVAGERAGIIAALVLSTSLMQAVVGRLAIMDALLDLMVMVGVLAFARAFAPSGGAAARDWAFALGTLALALGTLAKGPVAPVITVLVVAPWLVWEARAGLIGFPRPAAVAGAAALFALVTFPWFAALAARAGTGPLIELLGHYSIGRYTGVIENQRGPLWYYVPVLLLGFFPWVAFLPAAAVSAARMLRAAGVAHVRLAPGAALVRLAIVWAIVPFVFFSCAGTKLPNYVALIMPALAILVALWFERVAAGEARRAAIVSAATIPAFVGLVALAVRIFSQTNKLQTVQAGIGVLLAFLGVAMLAGSLLTVIVIARPVTTRLAPYVLALTSCALMLFIVFVAEPAAERYKPIPPIARTIEAQGMPGDVIGVHGVSGGNALIFYTRPPVLDISRNVDFRAAICPDGRAWIVASPPEADRLSALARTLGRSAEIAVAAPGENPRAALIHVYGAPCREVAARR